MRYFVFSALILCFCLPASADDNPTLKLEAPPNPNKGPQEQYLFRNNDGFFIIGPENKDGSAKYVFNGRENKDTLKFLNRRYVKDGRWGADKDIAVWVYEASDTSGNKWYLLFGEEPLTGVVQAGGKRLFPVYHTFDDPNNNNAVIKRWLTTSGTTRE